MSPLHAPSPSQPRFVAANAAPRTRRGPQGTASLAKTMELLDLVGLAQQPPTFAELASASGLPRGTAHRLLASLVSHGMVALTPDERHYVPGVHLLTLAQRTWERMDLRGAAEPALVELGRATEETVHLAMLAGDSIVYVDKVESVHPLRLHSAVGRRNAIHCTALGKVMAAYLDFEEQQAMAYRLDLQRHTAATLATPVAFLEALRKVRADGIAFDREEHVLGNHCVAAPVFDFRGRCIGAISVTAPTLRVDTRRLDSFADKVRHAARVTGQRLGGAPHGNTPHVAQEGT